jgi:hypothetical protein
VVEIDGQIRGGRATASFSLYINYMVDCRPRDFLRVVTGARKGVVLLVVVAVSSFSLYIDYVYVG